MRITRKYNPGHLLAALAALVALAPFGAVQAGTTPVANLQAGDAAPAYHSAFRDYQPLPARVAPDQQWLAANHAVQSPGMVMSHMAMQDAMPAPPGKPAPAAMVPMPSMPGMAPMPAMSGPPADPHAGHPMPPQHEKD